jgi:hypothetical protein
VFGVFRHASPEGFGLALLEQIAKLQARRAAKTASELTWSHGGRTPSNPFGLSLSKP